MRVTVADGDTMQRVPGAVVRIGRQAARTNRQGVVRIRIARRAALQVAVAAKGYSPVIVRAYFKQHRLVTVFVYQPRLQWTMYGATPERTQAQSAIRLRPPFHVDWSRGIDTLIEFPAVVSDGVAYIGNYNETIYALSMANGRVLWRHVTPGGKMASSPAVLGDAVIVHGMDGFVQILDRQTGRLRARVAIGSAIESSPVVRDGVDYFGDWSGVVHALDLHTLRQRWTYSAGYKITSSAALAGGTLYIGDYGGRLFALTLGGRLRWSASVNGRIYGTPAVSDGRVFVPSSDGGSLTAFTTSGGYIWRINTGSYVYSSPAAWGGRVFFGSYNGVFYGVSAASGRVLWQIGTGGAISGAAVVVGGVAYAGSFADRIYGVDALSGRVLLRFPAGQYVPVSGNGGKLLLHGYSRLFAVTPR